MKSKDRQQQCAAQILEQGPLGRDATVIYGTRRAVSSGSLIDWVNRTA